MNQLYPEPPANHGIGEDKSKPLKSFIHKDCDRKTFLLDHSECEIENGTLEIDVETLSDQAFQEFLTASDLDESLFCRKTSPDGVSATEIRVDLACHTIGYTRALLAQISQIVFFWARQGTIGPQTGSGLTQLLKLGLLKLQDTVRYSTEWGAKQMVGWWGKAYSPASFRNIRTELEAWGCFTVDRVAYQSTRKPTALHGLNIARLLEIAALAFQRLCDEPDGWSKFVPGHKCGFLAGIWSLFHPGTFYAPDSDPAPEMPIEDQIAVKRSAMDKARSMAKEFEWNGHLVEHYQFQAIVLARQIGNLEDMLYADF
jgi:hypothetical protein